MAEAPVTGREARPGVNGTHSDSDPVLVLSPAAVTAHTVRGPVPTGGCLEGLTVTAKPTGPLSTSSGHLHAPIPANISANRGSLSWGKMVSAFSTDFPASCTPAGRLGTGTCVHIKTQQRPVDEAQNGSQQPPFVVIRPRPCGATGFPGPTVCGVGSFSIRESQEQTGGV